MNFSKINELKPYDLNCNIFDVYSYDGLSMQELLCQFFTKINECINTSNETIDLAEWLVNEGLKQEVALQLTTWLNDGTLENLINVTLFENLNKKIDNVSSQLDHIKKKAFISITDFEGVGDGVTDNSVPFKNAIEYCVLNKKQLFIPSGNYLINEWKFDEAIDDITIFGEGRNSRIFYKDINNSIWMGKNFHIKDLDIVGYELLRYPLLVAGYNEKYGAFKFSNSSSVINVNISSTFHSNWTAIKVHGRNGGFYNFKIKGCHIGDNNKGEFGMGTCIDVTTFSTKGEEMAWLTDINVDDVFLSGFGIYGLNVKNDCDETSSPNQLTECSFTNIRVQAHNRGPYCIGVLVGGGGNRYSINSIFNDTGSTDFTSVYFYNHIIDKSFNTDFDFLVGNNIVELGMIEGNINFNNARYLNNVTGYSVNEGIILKNSPKNLIPNGNFEKDFRQFPVSYPSDAIFNSYKECLVLDGNDLAGKELVFGISKQNICKLNDSEYFTLYLLCSTDLSRTVDISTFVNLVVCNKEDYIEKEIISHKIINNKHLYTIYFKRNIDAKIEFPVNYFYIKIKFNQNLKNDAFNLFEIGISDKLLSYNDNIIPVQYRESEVVTVPSNSVVEINYKSLFGYYVDNYSLIFNSLDDVSIEKNKLGARLINNSDTDGIVHISIV